MNRSYVKNIEKLTDVETLKIERDLLYRIYEKTFCTGREMDLKSAIIMTMEDLDYLIKSEKNRK